MEKQETTEFELEIRSLEHIDFDTLFRGFENAFADYDIPFEKDEVRSMLERRGYNPSLSFAAFDDGQIVAFTLNGTGMFNGIQTAYDTGTGTVKQYRGRGIAGRIFAHSIPFLKDAGIRQYLLEVLQTNRQAISVYRRMNFEVTREFDCFRQSVGEIDCSGFNAGCVVSTVGADAICQAQSCCDFSPSWQNSNDSIIRGISGLTCLGSFIDGQMVGHCVFDANSGDLTRIAVRKDFRRRGIATRLLREAVTRLKTDFIKVLNIEAGNVSLPAFLRSRNILPASKQFEMMLREPAF